MQNKINDIKYLGCRKDKIRTAKPIIKESAFRMLVYWIEQRSKIHLLKDVYGAPKPWTADPILQTVRFTNVKRELDKETQFLIKTVCHNSDLTIIEKLANIFFFRIINKRQSVDGIFPIDFNPAFRFDYDFYRAWEKHFPADYPIFKKVYMISGPLGQIHTACPDESSFISVLAYTKLLFDNAEFDIVHEHSNAKQIFESLKNLKAIGNFLAYQMFVDLTYCPECPVSENEFVIAGPGCKDGLKLLFESKDGMTPEECLFWVRDNWNSMIEYFKIDWKPNEIFWDFPAEEQNLSVMALQNCFCELNKFNRAYNGGFVIRHYNGG